tara:strand:- start:2507 stop:3382 length:876 start_codon:yes stop_codon:yes gene_type:complete
MKGIVLAGGNGSRMYPVTKSVSKHLLCIYDKPMIYYPISTLLLAGIKNILIISTPQDLPIYKNLLGTGIELGLKIDYAEQKYPGGLAQAFIIAENYIGSDDVCMILGDNIFHGNGLIKLLKNAVKNTIKNKKATIFGYYVNDPERYGVLSFDKFKNVISIDEKPLKPNSNYAVVGLYFYPNSIINIAKNIKPSNRNELEITCVNNEYLVKNKLKVEIMETGLTWLDAGTPDSLLEASNFIQTVEKRQGLKIACIEEIVYNLGYISKAQLKKKVINLNNSEYYKYLLNITER